MPPAQMPSPRAGSMSLLGRSPYRPPVTRPTSVRRPSELAQRISDQYAAATSRPGFTVAPAAQVDQSRADEFRAREIALANQLAAQASGQAKGAGELAVARQTGQALGQAYGAATMGRGATAAGGARAAARAAGTIGLAGAGMASQAASSDQASARAQLAAVLSQGRGADLGAASQNASAQNAAQLEQVRADLAARGMNDQQIANLLQLMEQRRQYDQSRSDARNPTWQQTLGGILGQGAQLAAVM